jgi:hypothetical protein
MRNIDPVEVSLASLVAIYQLDINEFKTRTKLPFAEFRKLVKAMQPGAEAWRQDCNRRKPSTIQSVHPRCSETTGYESY